jgi:hypothetical protein
LDSILYRKLRIAVAGLKGFHGCLQKYFCPIFLAGTTTAVDNVDSREKSSASLFEYPITIFNTNRPDWDSTWREDITFAPRREQVLFSTQLHQLQ